MRFRHIPIWILCLSFSFSICAQQKQGYVYRPSSKGVGQTEVVGNASLEVMYAFNATDIRFHKEKRDKIYRMLIAINKDYMKTSGAVDPKTMQPKSMPHDYEPLEKE